MGPAEANATVVKILSFEDLPSGSLASRRAVVRWSDGSEGEAMRWYADEAPICEGDSDRQDARAAAVAAILPGPRLAPVVAPRRSPGGGQSG